MELFEQAEINFIHDKGRDYADIVAVAVDGAVVRVTFEAPGMGRAAAFARASTILAAAAREFKTSVSDINGEIAKAGEIARLDHSVQSN